MESLVVLFRRALQRPLRTPACAAGAPSQEPLTTEVEPSAGVVRLQQQAGARALPADWPEKTRQLHLWARAGQWLRYREGRLAMADILLRRGRTFDALEQFLDVWFVDLNGPRNASLPREALLATEQPPLDPAMGTTQTRICRQVRRLMAQLDLEADDVQAIFFDVAGATYRCYPMPVNPAQAWQAIGVRILA